MGPGRRWVPDRMILVLASWLKWAHEDTEHGMHPHARYEYLLIQVGLRPICSAIASDKVNARTEAARVGRLAGWLAFQDGIG
jgi:hypothetical protein